MAAVDGGDPKRARVSSFSTVPTAPKRIDTHNGSFHCDEALGYFMIRLTDKFSDTEIICSRDPKLLLQSDLDIVAASLSLHLRDLIVILRSGLHNAIILADPGPGASRADLSLFLRNLFARLQIGNLDLKQKALDSLLRLLDSDSGKLAPVVVTDGNIPALLRLLDLNADSSTTNRFVTTIRSSIGQVGELFVPVLQEMPLFYKAVLESPPGTQLFGGTPNPKEEVRLWKDHREKLEGVMVHIESDYIADAYFLWLKGCCEEIFGELPIGRHLIDAIGSGESLGYAEKLVREALDGRDELEESLELWLKSVFGSEAVSPWNQLRGFILKQEKDIWEEELDGVRWAVDVWIWVVCLEVGLLVSSKG